MSTTRTYLSISMLALPLGALVALSTPRPASADAPSPVVAASASAVAGGSAAPPSGDPAIVAALAALAECDGKKLGAECPPREAWKKQLEASSEGDGSSPEGKAKRVALAQSCLANVAHASRGVREAAAECIGEHAEHVGDRTAAAKALLAQLAAETWEDARGEQLRALRPLNPTELGLAKEVIALARPLLGKQASSGELEVLVSALEPYYLGPDLEPSPEAVAFAVELLGRREAVDEAIDVIEEVVAPSAEACKALLGIAETKRGAWADAIEALGGEGARCKEQRARAYEIVVDAATRPGSPSKKHGLGANARALAGFVEEAGLSSEQKAKLRDAIAAAEKAGSDAAELAPLREALGAK